MQVARAFTRPKFAGMLGSTHVPSALTLTVRLRTLTEQRWSSFGGVCAVATAGRAAISTSARTIRRFHSEGLCPSDSPTRELAGTPQAPLRWRGLTRALVRRCLVIGVETI